jgi:hypothetical protein
MCGGYGDYGKDTEPYVDPMTRKVVKIDGQKYRLVPIIEDSHGGIEVP